MVYCHYTRLPLAVSPSNGCVPLYGLNGCVTVTIRDNGPWCLNAELVLGVLRGLREQRNYNVNMVSLYEQLFLES